jgi:limonene-1,2-epoxide hydrolase
MNAEEVVRAELAAWSSLDVDQIMAHFAPESTWLPGFGFPTSSGYDEIREAVEGFVKNTSWCENEILNLAVSDNIVLTERVDHLVYDGERLDAPGMGTFEVVGEKITAWRDYFSADLGDARVLDG